MSVRTVAEESRDQALTRLVETYQHGLRRLCFMQLHDAALAEDAVQETFLKAYLSMRTFAGGNERAWLATIAIHVCRDMQRGSWFKRIDRRITPEDLPLATMPPDEGQIDLTMAVMNLPRKLREPVLLYYYQNMTAAEVAAALGIGQATVSERLEKARKLIRKELEGRDQDA